MFKSRPSHLSVLGLQSTGEAEILDYQSSESSVQKHLEFFKSKEFLGRLSKHVLDELKEAVLHEKKSRFKRRKTKKYGNLNKGFTEEELRLFLSCCKKPKVNLAFSLMANLGLRIGEVVKVRLEDVDLAKKRLYLLTEKARTHDSLYLHEEIAEKLKDWVNSQYNNILAHEGYLLFSDNGAYKRLHLSPNWLRTEFREAVMLAGLNEWYGKTDEAEKGRAQRKLHRLTTHSLRHYFITRVYKSTKDPVVAQKLARHTDLKSTQTYIHQAQSDLDVSMSNVFERGELAKKKEQDDLKKLVEVWRIMR